MGHVDQRFQPPLAFVLDLRQALVGTAQQVEALHRRGASAQGVEIENGGLDRLDGFASGRFPLRRRQPAGGGPVGGGQAHAIVRVLLEGAYRAFAPVGGKRLFQPAGSFFPVADFAPGEAERGADVGPLQPGGRLPGRDARHTAGDASAGFVVAAGAEIGGQVFQFGDQFVRRAEIRPDPLRRTAIAVEAEVRVAVTLVGAPGIDVRAARPHRFARRAHGLAEGFAGEHGAVESGGESLPGAVVDRPAGGDDDAHAHADELLAEVGGQAEAVELALTVERARDGNN